MTPTPTAAARAPTAPMARATTAAGRGVAAHTSWRRRPARPSASADAFTVYDLEQTKQAAHADAYVSPICGFDQFMDNHFALQQYKVPVDEITDALTALGNYWHCNRVGFGTIDVYAVEPTGDAIQLDGYLTDSGTSGLEITGCFNATNVLFHLCSQGKCHPKTRIAGSTPVGHAGSSDESEAASGDADAPSFLGQQPGEQGRV